MAHIAMPSVATARIVADNLSTVSRRIATEARRAGLSADDITLVAVGKSQPVERIEAALEAGHRVFGENRVQEAAGKWPDLRGRHEGVELHLIGPLQTNKIRDAVRLFDVIQTVDRPRLADGLRREMDRTGRECTCFIQVNTGEEPQKAGVLPQEADAFITRCRTDVGLTLAGLMCIPPADEEPALHFSLLRSIAERNGLSGLSMGMSGDFETAVAFGATHVRVGSAIFGERAGTGPG